MNNIVFNLGLIGWPVDHSLSPAIHQAALQAVGLKGSYELFPVPRLPDGAAQLEDLLNRMRAGNIQGLNVTVPHKQSVIPFLDDLTAEAQEIGAVNTVVLREGQLVGENTDARGFLNDLRKNLQSFPDDKAALILGVGGAGRAAAYALTRAGWQVTVAARRFEQAEILVRDLCNHRSDQLSAVPLSQEIAAVEPFQLLVNATPVGMAPLDSKSPWPVDLPLPRSCFVYDLVYNPKETVLIQQARALGLPACGGLGMLVEQAALSFEIWTGSEASRFQMYAVVGEDLVEPSESQEVKHDA